VIGARAGRGALALLVTGATLLGACATVTTAGGCGIQPGSVCPGTYMKGAKLAEANLYGANLDRSDLRGAELAIVVPLVTVLLVLSAWPAAISGHSFLGLP